MSWARADSESTFAACAVEEAATTQAAPSRERDHCNMEGPILCDCKQHLAPRSGFAMAQDVGTRAALKSHVTDGTAVRSTPTTSTANGLSRPIAELHIQCQRFVTQTTISECLAQVRDAALRRVL